MAIPGKPPLTQINPRRPLRGQAHVSVPLHLGVKVRRWRRWLAASMILGFASAQFVSLSHACVNGLEAVHGAVSHAASEAANAAHADCPGIAESAVPSPSACDGHCVPREQADRTVDARIALAPPNALVVRVVVPVASRAVRTTPPRATIASPPLSLLFGRFLN